MDYGTTGNWSGGTPIATNAVALENSNIDIGATLDQSAVALASFTQWASYTGLIGLHALGSTPGITGTYLQIDSAITTLGRLPFPNSIFPGSRRVMIDIGATTANAVVVESTAAYAQENGLPPTRLKGNKTTHTLEVRSGFVGVACNRSDETSTFGTITLGRAGGNRGNTQLHLGPGVTINLKVDVIAGYALLWNAFPAGNFFGGMIEHNGTGAVSGTVTVYPGATYIWNSTGTLATCVVKAGGKLYLNQSNAARTISQLTYDNPNDIIENAAVTVTARTLNVKGGGGSPWGTGP